ncbi:MAG: hypothetical protein SFV22_19645, partial [Saprospiraceae bacterium]|nr:hypothetical protein [Saprospiraceae bacterium]
MKQKLFFLSLLICGALPARAQMGPTTDANRKTGYAVRVEQAPRLDGDLDDACWQAAPVMSDFITHSPVFGNPAAEKTELRLVYT